MDAVVFFEVFDAVDDFFLLEVDELACVFEASVVVGLEGSAWARGMRFPGFSTMAIEGLVSLGRWREAEAVLRDSPPEVGWEEGAGGRWDGVFAGLIDVRTGRLTEAQTLLPKDTG